MSGDKPVGIWASDGEWFDHFYVPGREDLFDFFSVAFNDIDVPKMMKKKDFWEYWTTQFPYDVTIEGPFDMVSDFDQVDDFGAAAVDDLDKMVNLVKGKNLQPAYIA
jgi:hypothetical protein